MALRRRFLPVFKKHAPRGKPRFAKPLQGHFGPAAKHSQKHKNRPKIGRFSHFNPSAEMHPFSLFSASKAPQKWLCDAICRKKQLFAGSFGSRSHSFCSFTIVLPAKFMSFRSRSAHDFTVCMFGKYSKIVFEILNSKTEGHLPERRCPAKNMLLCFTRPLLPLSEPVRRTDG